MDHIARRDFLKSCAALPFLMTKTKENGYIQTVKGKILPAKLGRTLIHEHILVDFIGADKIHPARWNRDKVISKVLPYLLDVRKKGIQCMLECTPAFLGRDVELLEILSEKSGLTLVTNTGYYGAADNKFLPEWAFDESDRQLAARWINEFENGIDNTQIKPGFIKIGVNPGPLSALHQKLVSAAAITHLKTGLTICSHTGPALPAQEEIAILKKYGVNPNAFVWVHANGADDEMLKTAASGCWVSLDGVSESNIEKVTGLLSLFRKNGMLGQILISHDAGWYKPGEENGGTIRGYTTISENLLPALQLKGFSEAEIVQLMEKNPAEAFAIRIRKL